MPQLLLILKSSSRFLHHYAYHHTISPPSFLHPSLPPSFPSSFLAPTLSSRGSVHAERSLLPLSVSPSIEAPCCASLIATAPSCASRALCVHVCEGDGERGRDGKRDLLTVFKDKQRGQATFLSPLPPCFPFPPPPPPCPPLLHLPSALSLLSPQGCLLLTFSFSTEQPQERLLKTLNLLLPVHLIYPPPTITYHCCVFSNSLPCLSHPSLFHPPPPCNPQPSPCLTSHVAHGDFLSELPAPHFSP